MKEVILIASGDLRLSANQMCEEAQAAMEKQIVAALQKEGATVKRGHPFDPVKKHGFIDSQKYGMAVFRKDRPRCALDCRRGCLAVFASRFGGSEQPSRADLDPCELERDLARPRRNAEFERLTHQSGRYL